MGIGYYFKLTFFVLLAVGGGLVGAAAGAILGFGISLVIIASIGPLMRNLDPMFVGFSMIEAAAIVSFFWSFLKSYTYFVRNFW